MISTYDEAQQRIKNLEEALELELRIKRSYFDDVNKAKYEIHVLREALNKIILTADLYMQRSEQEIYKNSFEDIKFIAEKAIGVNNG